MRGVKQEGPCIIDGCEKPPVARGWCGMHWYRWSKHGDPLVTAPRRRNTDVCDAPGCERPTPTSKYCLNHGRRLRRTGQLELRERPDRRPHSGGYFKLKDPSHPLATLSGWVYEHRAALFAVIGPGDHECHWCGTLVSWDRRYPEFMDALVVDHVDEDKANNDPTNLVPSCARCNFARSSRWKKRRREASA